MVSSLTANVWIVEADRVRIASTNSNERRLQLFVQNIFSLHRMVALDLFALRNAKQYELSPS